MIRIPVASPALVGNERKYVLDCIDSTWISSKGSYVERFEAQFAEFIGTRYATGCCNGTAALHAALLALGVGPGDEVIVPTLTYVATANAVLYCGGKPVFVESEPITGNMDAARLAEAISERTKGIIVVHLYGQPANLKAIQEIAARHNVFLLEDAAEAHGAEYLLDGNWRRVGSLGDMSIFSFFGNKVVTTGEGGMIVTDNADLYQRTKQLINQGQDPDRRYWFPMVGYNYRMTNVEAAIGLAQLECVDWHVQRRREIALQYRQLLNESGVVLVPPQTEGTRSVFWMTCALIDRAARLTRDEVSEALEREGIETRPYFPPMHQLPIYRGDAQLSFPIAEDLAARGMNLPSSATLTEADIQTVSTRLLSLLA